MCGGGAKKISISLELNRKPDMSKFQVSKKFVLNTFNDYFVLYECFLSFCIWASRARVCVYNASM